MLSGSAFLRVVILLVVAAGLAGLVQFYWLPHAPEPEPVAVPEEPPRPARRIDPAPMPAPIPAPATPSSEVQIPAQPAPTPQISPPPVPAVPSPEAPPPAAPQVSPSPTPAEDAAEIAADNAGPRATAIVDLNTASVAELNALKGGGMIGRSIVQKRPYTSVDQLLSKRVLSRATYERIKDQVTVR
jgi:hypothetical protein